jgi:tetratricopeptide (TPR) repeat protein
LADTLLLAGEFPRALKIADEAIVEAASTFWVAPEERFWYPYANTIWLHNIRAHALMFLPDRATEARDYFLKFQTSKRDVYTSWEYVTLRQFVQLRRQGFSHPLMNEIERHYSGMGFVRDTTEDVPLGVDGGLDHAAEIESADLLAKQGTLKEAVIEYRRILTICTTSLAEDQNNRMGQAEHNLVAGRIDYTARRFLLAGKFVDALNCAKESIVYDPLSTSLNLDRAHALMLHGDPDGARDIYFEYYGKRMSGGRLAQHAIRDDFETLRKAERKHQLMIEVEGRFAAAKWDEKLNGKAGASGADLATGGSRSDDRSKKEGALSLTPAPAVRTSGLQAGASTPPLGGMEAGHAKLSEGKLDQALAIYQLRLKQCERTLASGAHNLQAIDDRYIAVNKITDIALRYIVEAQYEKAGDALDYAVPLSSFAHVRRAHLLMFLGKTEEAKIIYHQYRNQKMTSEQTGESVILQDFSLLRRHKRTHELMDEIETLFSAPKPESQHRTLTR